MMVGHPFYHPQEVQQPQRPLPPAADAPPAALFRGRGRSRGRRLPPFLAASSSSSSSFSASSSGEGNQRPRNAEEEQQQVAVVGRRRGKSRRGEETAGRAAPALAAAAPPSPRILRRLSSSLIRRRRGGIIARKKAGREAAPPSPSGLQQQREQASAGRAVVDFLQGGACPREVLPLVLAYAGPQASQALAGTNRFWSGLLREEATWKVQCQELYKWTPGVDEEPESWRELYRSSPCVPVDYPSIERALAAVPDPVTVWLRPGGEFVLERPVTVSADLTIRVMDVPVAAAPAGGSRRLRAPPSPAPRPPSARARAPCLPQGDDDDGGAAEETWRSSDDSSSGGDDEGDGWSVAPRQQRRPSPPVSTIVLHTHLFNKPVFWVQSGCLTLERVVLSHACLGVDIWSGNAALQVQPAARPVPPAGGHGRRQQQLLQQQAPPDGAALPPPRAVLNQCQVTSQSGRGVVVMGGGQALIQRSSIVDCAATGVYIGGAPSRTANADANAAPAATAGSGGAPGRSRADLHGSQVSGNGVGSYYRDALALSPTGARGGGLLRGPRFQRRSSVIARGHSGVYLEQGDCRIESSVIRSNALTGISAVSDQARLVVSGSTLEANGAQQLEAVPSRLVRLENNRIVDNPHEPPPRPGGMPLWPLAGHDQDMENFVRMVMDQP